MNLGHEIALDTLKDSLEWKINRFHGFHTIKHTIHEINNQMFEAVYCHVCKKEIPEKYLNLRKILRFMDKI